MPRRWAASFEDRRSFFIAEEGVAAARLGKGSRPITVEAVDLPNSKGLVFLGSPCRHKPRENRTSWAMGPVLTKVSASSIRPFFSPATRNDGDSVVIQISPLELPSAGSSGFPGDIDAGVGLR